MDFNHDYNGINGLLVSGVTERLQLCKSAILAMGDLGYTDPGLPDIRDVLGEYTDSSGVSIVEDKVREILIASQVVSNSEIVSIDVTIPDASTFLVDLKLTFGEVNIELPSMYVIF